MDGKEQVEEATHEEAPQTKTLTQAEIDALVSRAKEEGEKSALDKYKGIQRTIAKKDEEIKKLQSQRTQPLSEALNETLEELKGLRSGDIGDELTTGERNKRITLLQQRLAKEQGLAKQEEIVQTKRDEFNQKILDAGYDPADDIFADFDESFDIAVAVDGKFERAEKKLNRILTAHKKETPKEKPVEDEAKLRERIEREILEKHGLLTPEKMTPVGGKGRVWSRQEIAKMSPEEYRANHDDIVKAQSEGRVK